MATQAIHGDWRIELDPEFRRKAEGGDVVLWAPGRTVYVSVFRAGSAEAEEAVSRMIEGRKAGVRQTFDRLEPGLVGHAYLLPERQEGREYWGLNTWLTARGSVVCVTFYFDQLDELPWALAAWQSVRREGTAGPELPN